MNKTEKYEYWIFTSIDFIKRIASGLKLIQKNRWVWYLYGLWNWIIEDYSMFLVWKEMEILTPWVANRIGLSKEPISALNTMMDLIWNKYSNALYSKEQETNLYKVNWFLEFAYYFIENSKDWHFDKYINSYNQRRIVRWLEKIIQYSEEEIWEFYPDYWKQELDKIFKNILVD